MASSLVRLECNKSTMVRVMNPFPKEALLKNGTIMGEANPFEQVIQFLDEEESVSKDSTEVAQRLQVIQSDEVSSTVDSPSLSYIEEGSTCVSPKRSGVQIQIPSHLQDLYERTTSVIAMGKHCKVAELLRDFSETFSKNEDDLGCTNLTSHVIDTGNARPVKQAPRRTPSAFEGRDREALEKMLSRGTIRESTSPWASPVVLVPKKDGSVRVCVDYRRVNDLNKKDAFPLPKISDCLDAVSGSVYFSTLDLTSGYNQVPVAEEDIPKTAFVTKYGLF